MWGHVMETGDHVLLHCPKTELVWNHAITLASAAVVGTPAEQRLGGMSREAGLIGHLLGSRELADMPTEVALRGAATHAVVSGLGFVDAKLKVERGAIRAMAAEAAKCKRADARAKAKAEGGPTGRPFTAVTGCD